MSESYEYLFKFLVIGSAGTGKSSLLNNFIGNKFKEDRCHTIGVEFGSKIVNIGGKSTKLQIWDTAGQERFRSVTRSYYRGAAGALLVYDITSRDSFNALCNWLRDARTLASPNIVILLVGNKKDLEESREVTFSEASQFAQENELMFLETSAKTGENVEEAFLKCSKTILAKIETGELDPERIGSGIQYGTGTSKRLATPKRPRSLYPKEIIWINDSDIEDGSIDSYPKFILKLDWERKNNICSPPAASLPAHTVRVSKENFDALVTP